MPTAPTRRAEERPLKIACVHTSARLTGDVIGAMNFIRFVRMSEALARRGHEVHLVVNGTLGGVLPPGGPVEVQASGIRWDDYDVVKTFFHRGFASLEQWGGADHPFIISNLGSVVASGDEEGVYFFGNVRDDLWDVQQKIAARSRVVSILTDRSIALWRRMHGGQGRVIPVPTGVDADVPGPGRNPYAARGITGPVALFASNIYSRDRQPEVNLFWQARLNALGRGLSRQGVRLVAMGPGAVDRLDPSALTHVGVVDFREIWNWQYHASVGVVLAQGPVQDNESSKIYYYLRTGLPVACEAPVPNAWLVSHTGHGAVVEYEADDVIALAEAAAGLARRPPEADGVVRYVVDHHSWDARAAIYAPVLAEARPD
jgi:hypothetical protein